MKTKDSKPRRQIPGQAPRRSRMSQKRRMPKSQNKKRKNEAINYVISKSFCEMK